MLLGAGFGIICPMKLSEYIGETSSYDKKLMLERDNPLSWLKSVSAFANTMGGKLLFGVSDDGELVGLVNAEKDAEYISEAIKTQIDPIPQTKLSIHEELRGSGFGKIIDAYKTASERIGREVTPTFSSDAADFFLTLPNLNYGLSATSGTLKSSAKSSGKSSGKSSAKSSGKELTKAAKIIVRAIRSNAMVTIPELQKRLLFSDSGIRKVLNTLKREGFIRRVGGRKLGHWELTDKSSRV